MYDISRSEKMLAVRRANHQATGLFDADGLTGEDRAAGQLDAHLPAESAAHLPVRLVQRLLPARTELLVAGGPPPPGRAGGRGAGGGGPPRWQRGGGGEREGRPAPG